MSDRKTVAVLWAMVLVLFAAFSAAYWPVRRWQQARAPEAFHARALALEAAGDRQRAIAALQAGRHDLRPPCAAPYADLARWLREAGDPEADRVAATAAFYEAAAAPQPERGARLIEAARRAAGLDPVRAARRALDRPAAMLAGALGAAVGAGTAALDLEPAAQLALLRAAGGAIDDTGRIGSTGVSTPVDILVQSGGGEGGRRQAHIVVAGRDWARPQRGLHVALIDAQSGQVFGASYFDLWEAPQEADRMLEYLAGAPPGCIGAFAVYDDASEYLTPALEAALIGFGLARQAIIGRAPALYGMRYSFAAIGVKGAPEGSALQAWSPFRFTAPDGAACDGHPVACAVLRAEPAP